MRYSRNHKDSIPFQVFSRRQLSIGELAVFTQAQLVDSKILPGNVRRVISFPDFCGDCWDTVDDRHHVHLAG